MKLTTAYEPAARCAKCGCPVAFDGIVDLGEEEGGFEALAAFRCTACRHGFVDLVARSRALAMDYRLRPAV